MVDSVLNFFLGGAALAPPTKIVDRISNVKLEKEECVLRLEFVEGQKDVVHLQLFSLDNGIYGARYEHSNLAEILGFLKTLGYTVNFNEDKSKVVFHVGPRGVLPIELEKYGVQTTENKVQLLSEEVRRLNSAQEEVKKENDLLRARLEKLERMVMLQSR